MLLGQVLVVSKYLVPMMSVPITMVIRPRIRAHEGVKVRVGTMRALRGAKKSDFNHDEPETNNYGNPYPTEFWRSDPETRGYSASIRTPMTSVANFGGCFFSGMAKGGCFFQDSSYT